jgi:hypothetical protein
MPNTSVLNSKLTVRMFIAILVGGGWRDPTRGRAHVPMPEHHAAAAVGAWASKHRHLSTIHRTGRLLAPWMPVSSSAFAARSLQPSWRMRARI